MVRTSLILPIALLAAFSQAQVAGAVAKPVTYSIQALGPIAGKSGSMAIALNDRGEVVGASTVVGSSFEEVATIWRNGLPQSLGIVNGGTYSVAEGINEQGRVSGEADDGDIRPLCVVFEQGEALIIDTGGNNSRGIFVADSGEVIGNYARGFGGDWLPTLWSEEVGRPGRWDQLHLPLYLDGSNFSYNYINAANDGLEAVGQVSSLAFSSRGGYWQGNAAHTLRLLQPIAGYHNCYAYGINNAEIIVGVSDVGTSGDRPTFWNARAGFAPNSLPLLPGENFGTAFGINEAGVVIGTHGVNALPAIWFEGRIYDLMSLIDGSSAGWTNLVVSDINNVGQIVGQGDFNGLPRGFILHPTPGISKRRVR